MEIQAQGSKKEQILKGHYSEQLTYPKKGSWQWYMHKIYLNPKREFTESTRLTISFDNNFKLTSFHKTVDFPKKFTWDKGEVRKGKLFLTNSREVTKTVEIPSGAIPEELLLLRFITQNEKEAIYQSIALSTGQITRWQLKLKEMREAEQDFSPPIAKKKSKSKITLLTIEAYKMEKIDTKPNPSEKSSLYFVYQVAIQGQNALPGVVIAKEDIKKKHHYSWIHKYVFVDNGYSCAPLQPVQYDLEKVLDRLREHVAQLLSDDSAVRYQAVREIGAIKLWQGVPALIEMLEDEDEKVRTEAYKILCRMTQKTFSPNIQQWRGWWVSYQEERNRKETGKSPDTSLDSSESPGPEERTEGEQ
jgi:hypothetical protein